MTVPTIKHVWRFSYLRDVVLGTFELRFWTQRWGYFTLWKTRKTQRGAR